MYNPPPPPESNRKLVLISQLNSLEKDLDFARDRLSFYRENKDEKNNLFKYRDKIDELIKRIGVIDAELVNLI